MLRVILIFDISHLNLVILPFYEANAVFLTDACVPLNVGTFDVSLASITPKRILPMGQKRNPKNAL